MSFRVELLDELKDGPVPFIEEGVGWPFESFTPIEKHTPGGQEHDQEAHGRWARGVAGKQLSDRAAQGFTIDPLTGEEPKRGFPVAFKAHELIIESNDPRVYANYITEKMGEFRKGFKLGGWYDTETGELFLDVVEVIDGDDYVEAFDRAAAQGRAENQRAIFDLLNFEEIRMDDEAIADYRSRLEGQ
jgi:hypothetical protein